MADNRIPAFAYWAERVWGEKVPVCPRCHSEDLSYRYSRCSYDCGGCGWEIASQQVLMVPKDTRARTLKELHGNH